VNLTPRLTWRNENLLTLPGLEPRPLGLPALCLIKDHSVKTCGGVEVQLPCIFSLETRLR
jgi:hypothetical protein